MKELPDEKNLLEISELASDFEQSVRELCTLSKRKSLILSNRDRHLFMSVMENPPRLKGFLKSAIQKYREKYER